MAELGLQNVDTYVSSYHNKATQFIATRTIMDLCMAVERRMGSQESKMCWEHDCLDLEGMWTAAWEAERTEGGEETDGTVTETE